MKRKRLTSKPISDTSEVDLTPMLDVVFILLIFFIITASFVKETALDIASPSSSQLSNAQSVAMLIKVDEENTIYIDGREVIPKSLRAVLIKKQTEQEGRLNILVNAHENSNTQTYASVANAARQLNGSVAALRTYRD